MEENGGGGGGGGVLGAQPFPAGPQPSPGGRLSLLQHLPVAQDRVFLPGQDRRQSSQG